MTDAPQPNLVPAPRPPEAFGPGGWPGSPAGSSSPPGWWGTPHVPPPGASSPAAARPESYHPLPAYYPPESGGPGAYGPPLGTQPLDSGAPGAYGPPVPYPSPSAALTPYPPASLVPKPSPLPDGPREYQQMLRGARRRWWKPPLTLLLAAAIWVALMLLAFLPVLVLAALAGVADPVSWTAREVGSDAVGPAQFLYLCLTLAGLIPAVMLAVWAVHRIRPRFVTSVTGGIRWRWALRCLLVLTPLWVAYLGLSLLLEPENGSAPAQWGLLLAIAVVVMPFQAAGEEYLFRGWLLQNVGAYVRHPIVALVIGTALSAVLFSVAHGSLNIWILLNIGAMAVTLCLLTWRTGGLEAAVVMHAVNNVGVSIVTLYAGGWEESFVSPSTTSTPTVFAVSVLLNLIVCALIFWQAKRVGLPRLYVPPHRADPPLSLQAPGVPLGPAFPGAGRP